MIHESLWRTVDAPRFAAVPLPNEVDVVIVGGGITGLTVAHLLKQSGQRVAVFERERIGSGDSGNTSAHLTCITDRRPTDLAKRFGASSLARIWQGHAAAIDLIESNTRYQIACGFRRVPGFLSAPFFGAADLDVERERLCGDAALLMELGFAAEYLETGPVMGQPAISLTGQAVFHPLDYLVGLALAVDGDGSIVREHCQVRDAIQDPLAVIVNGETVACNDLVIATHVPLMGIRNLVGATLFQTKLYPYSSYALGARLDDSSPLMPGLYEDTSDPYYYLRVHERAGGRYAIFGGEDHKTGQATDTDACFERLSECFGRLAPSAKIERGWSGQVIETPDGLPYIGEVAPHQYIATGYTGNGLTYGTLAGLMIHDAILGGPNPWQAIFDPHRKASSVEAFETLVSENFDYPLHYLSDRLRGHDGSGIENVPRGGGKVIAVDGRRLAVHRRDDGTVVKVDAICTHMGCLVRWNEAERTWDCPCHGSRFTPEGLVLGGPAESPLEQVD